MFCPNCGSELKDNNDLCLNCGWRRETAENEVTTKKQIPIKAIISIVIIIVILITIYITYMFTPPHFKNDGIGDYYKKSDGTYATNEWVKIKNNWYFFNQGGYLAKGGVTADWYYVDDTGKMITNEWKKINGVYFYFDKDGMMARNKWIENKDKWYYVDTNGAMLKNTWVDGGYYVNNNGEMLKDTVTPDGIKVDKNGKSSDYVKIKLLIQSRNIRTVPEYSSDTLVDEMDTVTFGSYPQSDISGNIKEPIEWLVLEKNDSEMLLLSKYILDCKCYNDEPKDVTWETCTLRQWLNDVFYNTAFNNVEKKNIIKSYVENKFNDGKVYGGNDTNDYVYSLSLDECKKYFGIEDVFNPNRRSTTKSTKYAKNVEDNNLGGNITLRSELGGYSDYWFRNPGFHQSDAAAVIGPFDGASMSVDAIYIGVRPLIRVKYR